MSSQLGIVSSRNWADVEQTFYATAPYNYAILDTFLDSDACKRLYEKLVNHWGWRYKNWMSQHLHNNEPDIPEVFEIVAVLKEQLPTLLQDKDLVSHWALMYHKNTPGRLHADNTGVTLSFWLTPEKYNLDPSTGGLVFFDVKRTPEIMPHEHLGNDWSEEYVKQHTHGKREIISYKSNRALLFDGRTFHKTDTLRFEDAGPYSRRINLSFAFDNPQGYIERMRKYELK